MVFQKIADFLYGIFVKSRIVWYLMPLTQKYLARTFQKNLKNIQTYLEVEGGQKLPTTVFNGKNYPPFGEGHFSKIKNLKMRPDDVIIGGFAKTGCHWTYEVLMMILTKNTSITKYGKARQGMMEFLPEFVLDSIPSPRVLNSHLLYEELPQEMKTKKAKIVLTTRCPKDVLVSYYGHWKSIYHYQGSFDDFFKRFNLGGVYYGSYFDTVADWRKVIASSPPNPIFVVEYEDMKKDTVAMIKKLARFLDQDITEEFAQEIARCTDFNRLKTFYKDDEFAAPLFRKGIVGDWKNWMTEEQSAEVDAKMEEIMKQ